MNRGATCVCICVAVFSLLFFFVKVVPQSHFNVVDDRKEFVLACICPCWSHGASMAVTVEQLSLSRATRTRPLTFSTALPITRRALDASEPFRRTSQQPMGTLWSGWSWSTNPIVPEKTRETSSTMPSCRRFPVSVATFTGTVYRTKALVSISLTSRTQWQIPD